MKRPFSRRVLFWIRHGHYPEPLTWAGVVAVMERVSAENGGRCTR